MWRLDIRSFIVTLVALAIGPFAYAQNTVTYSCILRSNFGDQTMWDGESFRVYGITSTINEPPHAPAATLFCNEGDSMVLNALSFSQGDHHTIHLHGLDVDTRNDGDPATSFSLSHLQDTTYSFRADHAGTYLYHCHVGDVVHVQMGMYGLLVVRAAGGVNTAWTGGPAYDQEKNWITSEMDRSWHDTIPVHDAEQDTLHIPPYRPDYFLINGKSHQELMDDDIRISAAVGEKVYLRMGNIGFFTNRVVFPSEVDAEVIDSDGRPIPNAFFTDTLDMMPGERYGVMLTPLQEFDGMLAMGYVDMDTDSLWDTQDVPIHVQGTIGYGEPAFGAGAVIYPNPAWEHITLRLPPTMSAIADHLTVSDVLGRPMIWERYATDVPVDMKALPSGAYTLRLFDRSGVRLLAEGFLRE